MSKFDPRGEAPLGQSAQLLGMSPSLDLCAGYPLHRVEVWTTADNGITRYRASCGYNGSTSSRLERGGVHKALRGELCSDCWTMLVKR